MQVADFAAADFDDCRSEVDESRRRAPWLKRAKEWLDERAVRGCCQDTHTWAAKTELLRSLRTAGPQAL